MKANVLSARKLASFLKKNSHWKVNAKQTELCRTFKTSYIKGLMMIARIAVLSETRQHHPKITYTHNAVKISLTTHTLGALSDQDIELAKAIESQFTD